jgi:hypothetical protein
MEEINSALTRIVKHIEKNAYFMLPHKYYTTEDGTALPISILIWKTVNDDRTFEFGISVYSRGKVEHQMFNIKERVEDITEQYIQTQLERVTRILARPLRPLCNTLGPNKGAMMLAVGMDKKALGIEECCVCARETTMKTLNCSHSVCLLCLNKVDKCPMCRADNEGCACCLDTAFESENEDESDDEFCKV